ncbi:MAG: C39 family peptidase [Candidatus Latescibacteria bacterium]|nr:C39 family peptidase [Candidatus Latescibacterota bacterium]
MLDIETQFLSGTLDELCQTIENGQPVIALLWTGVLKHWQQENAIDYLHAVVVTGVDEENIFINDPVFSDHPITLLRKEFLDAWSYARQTMVLLKQI